MKNKNNNHSAESYLKRIEEERSLFFDLSVDMLCFAGFDGYFKQLNPAWSKILGWSEGELLSKPWSEFIHPEDLQKTVEAGEKIMQGQNLVRFENRYLCKDGTYRWFTWNAYPMLERKLIFGVARDITERFKTIEELNHSNRILKTISECNQSLLRATDEVEMMKNICNLIVESGGYRFAWMGLAEKGEQKLVRPIVYAGYENGYLKSVKITYDESETGLGPTGTAIRTNQICYARDIQTDPLYKPWREEALRRGYRSSIALPIEVKGEVIGTLNLYSGEANSFSQEELNLLTGLRDNLAFGISNLRDQKAKSEAELTLKSSEDLLRTVLEFLPIGVWLINKEGKIIYGNTSVQKIWGGVKYVGIKDYGVYKAWWISTGKLIEPEEWAAARAIQKRETSIGEEIEIEGFDGSHKFILNSAVPIVDDKDELKGCVKVNVDITDRILNERRIAHLASFPELDPNPVIELDTQGRIIFYNPATIAILDKWGLGTDASSLLPQDIEDIIQGLLKGESNLVFREVAFKDQVFWQTITFAGDFKTIRIYAIDITDRKLAESEVRKLSQYLETAIDNANIWFDVLDAKANVIIWNKAAERLSGYSRLEVVGHGKIWEWLYPDPDYRNEIVTKAAAIIEKGEQVEDFETAIRCKDGSTKTIAWHSRNLLDEQGNPTGSVAFGRNVTLRKLAEEELKLNEMRLEALFTLNQMADAPFQEISDFALEKGVELTKSKFGYIGFMNKDETSLTVSNWSSRVMPECRVQNKPIIYYLENSGLWGEAVRKRMPVITNDYQALKPAMKGYPEGHIEITRYMNVPLFEGSKIVLIAAVANKEEDYTETDVRQLTLLMQGMWRLVQRKKSETALRESEEKYRNLVDSLTDGILTSDLEENITFSNLAGEALFGQPEGGLIRHNLKEFLSPEEYSKVKAHTVERIGFKRSTYETELVLKDGTKKQIMISASPLYDETGKVTGSQGIFRDISAYRKLEAQYLQAQKMEAIGRLAGGVAHDFNNLLTVITGNAEMAKMSLHKMDPLNTELEQIIIASRRASNLTGQLLAFSRKQVIQPQVFQVNQVLTDLEKMLRRMIGEDIILNLNLHPEAGKARVDRSQLEQVILNLTVNARDSMPDGGKLVLETAPMNLTSARGEMGFEIKPGDYVTISVTDTGVGMTEEVKSKIFEPFFTTKKVGEGTGLGLATVYGIIKQSEGFITVYSELGQGSTFKIYLPQVQEAETAISVKKAADSIPKGSETILVVEDEEGVRALAVRTLKKFGYVVIEAESGASALLLCQDLKKPIDMVVTDVIMPNMSGPEMVENLKKICPKLKILYMSGHTFEVISKKGIMESRIPFMQKPFEPLVFARKVREVLDSQ